MQPAVEDRTVREFILHECLGRGGFGEVYRATMRSPQGVSSVVAFKVLHGNLRPGDQALRRLRDEARVLGALNHPAILSIHDLVELGGQFAMVSEYVPGADLATLFRIQTVPPSVMLDVVAQIADALDAAWKTPDPVTGKPLHLVHRDIKPANVRVGRHGQVKLLDFGIASANMDREASTGSETLVGTYQYMAPERFDGRSDPPGDIFSLGCLLYEGLAARRLFSELSVREMYALSVDSDRFASFVDERVGSLAEGPGRALVTAMLLWDPTLRPTPEELFRNAMSAMASVAGPPTREWVRTADFPSEVADTGSLSGNRVSEGAAIAGIRESVGADDSVETIEKRSPRRTRGTLIPWVGALIPLVLGGVVLLAFVVGLTLSSALAPAGPMVAALRPTPPLEVLEPLPGDGPKRVEIDSTRRPVAEPAAMPTRVTTNAAFPVQLRRASRIRTLPDAVSAGRWDIWADFGDGYQRAGQVEVADREVEIRCRVALRSCEPGR